MSNDTTMSEVRRQVTAEEWQTRIELAAAYRLVAHFGWDDLIFTHISARVPGQPDQFLITTPTACCSTRSPRPAWSRSITKAGR